MGAKKIEMKNMIPVVIAVNPVLPPSTATISKVIYSKCPVDGLVPLIPVADSMHTLTGLVPNREPRTIQKATTQYAVDDPSKSKATESYNPATLAMVPRALKNCMNSATISQLDFYPVASTECCGSILDEVTGERHTQNVDIKEGNKCIPYFWVPVVVLHKRVWNN